MQTLNIIAQLLNVTVQEDTNFWTEGVYNSLTNTLIVKDLNDTATVCHELWHRAIACGVQPTLSKGSNNTLIVSVLDYHFSISENQVEVIANLYDEDHWVEEVMCYTLENHPEVLLECVVQMLKPKSSFFSKVSKVLNTKIW